MSEAAVAEAAEAAARSAAAACCQQYHSCFWWNAETFPAIPDVARRCETETELTGSRQQLMNLNKVSGR